MTDKTPLEERSTEELEELLETGKAGSRKKRDVEHILNRRRRQSATEQRYSDVRRQTWGNLALWASAGIAALVLAWVVFEFFATR